MTILFSVGGLVGDLSLEEQIIVAKQAGFDGIDYIASIKDLFFTPKKITRLTEKYKITINAVHIPVLLVLYTPSFLFLNIKNLLRYFPESQRFNFHLSGFLNPFRKQIRGLEKFKQVMKENKITMSCESNPDEYFIFKHFPKETYDPDFFAQFCIKYNLPINLDTSHIAGWNYDIVKFFKKYHVYINLLHISDMTPDKQHLPFGKGILPLKELFKEIKTVSYNGLVIFEISNFPKGTSKESLVEELKNNLKIFKRIAH